MKSLSVALVVVVAALAGVTGHALEPTSANLPVFASVVERGANYRVMQTTGQYTVLGNGMNRKDDSGNWVECQPVVQSYPGGIICTGATYRLILATNLNTAGAVDFETSDHKRIVSNPLGIGFYDPESGRSVLLAQIKDCQAEVSSDGIVFRDAFEGSHGVQAAVTYRYEMGRFRQDVTFLTRPSVGPADFGMGQKTRLEVLTEILESPQPDITVHIVRQETNVATRASMVEPDLVDETLKFGDEMVMPPGRAFRSGAAASAQRGVRVFKQLVTVDGRLVLVEAVEWDAVRAALDKLPQQSADAGGSKREASSRRHLPERRVAHNRTQPFEARLTQALQSRSPMRTAHDDRGRSTLGLPAGFVLDYDLVQSGNDVTLQSGHTYLLTNDVLIYGLTLQSNVVIKYAPGASLSVGTSVDAPTSPKVVLTAADDDSAGQTIAGSTGHPSGRYAEHALASYYLSYPYWNKLDIRYAQTGLYLYGGTHGVSSSSFFECDTGVYVESSEASLYGVDMCLVDAWFNDEEMVTATGLTECAADRNANGLPDSWEQQHFGNLSQTATNDFDGDGVNNGQEYTNSTDPNTISFSFSVPNQYVITNVVTGVITVLGGVPSSIAVQVDSTNFSGATWTTYSSSNLTINIGTNQGLHDVWIGLRGRLTTSQQTWDETTLVLDSLPLSITITNPANNASFSTSRVNVRGTFSNSSLKEITVNGVLAFVSGTNFDALNVPLDAGTNLVMAVIENFSGITNSASVSIIGATNAVDPVQLTADPVAGLTPLTVAFTVQTNLPGTILQVLYDFNGDDVIDLATNTLQSLAYSYATNGEYFPVVTIQTSAGWFSSSGGWNSIDPARLRVNVQAPPAVLLTINLTNPVDLKWTATSNLYVLSCSTATLTEFDAGTNIVRSLSGIGSSPSGLDVDAAGNVYVAVTGSNQVWRFKPTTNSFEADTNFGFSGFIGLTNGISGTNAGEFNAPFDVAVSPDGTAISVSDSGNHRIQQFDSNGIFIASFGSQGTNVGQFNAPKGVAYDSAGTLYVVDSGNSRIALVEGTVFEGVTGTNGTALGQFNGPVNISFDDRAVYVADSGNNRIQSFKPPAPHIPFSSDPSAIRFVVSTNLNQPAAVAATGSLTNETFYVADTGNNRVLLYRLLVDDPTPAWTNMASHIAAGNVSGAISYFSIVSADEYRHDFLSIGTANAASAINPIGMLTPVFIQDDEAEYYFQQVVDGKTITFPVEFVKENGVWKILEF